MKNPNPIKRARRLEMRRKQLGSDRCFYCGESDVSCLEIEHPVTRKLDAKFTRAVCRNCHRKLEMNRDLGKLTKNGLHTRHNAQRNESPAQTRSGSRQTLQFRSLADTYSTSTRL